MPTESIHRRDSTSLSPLSLTTSSLVDTPSRDTVSENSRNDEFVPPELSGRKAPTGLAGSFISTVNSHVGAMMRIGVGQALREVGLEKLEKVVEDGGGEIELPFGTSLALRLTDKTYKPGDRYIASDVVRKACDDAYKSANKSVVWNESRGIAELGNGGAGTMPLGELASASAEFRLSGVVRYRRLEPYEAPSGVIDQGVALYNNVQIPFSSKLAKEMPAGAEFEITGEGHATLKPEASGHVDAYDAGIASIALDGRIGSSHDVKGEVSIAVQKLPVGDQVMVKVCTTKGVSSSLEASLCSSANVEPKILKSIPKAGQGIIKYVLEKMGLPNLDRLVKYFKASVKAEASSKNSNRNITRYVFDLSKKEGAAAYEEIFTKLSTKSAVELAVKPESGVKMQGGSESESAYRVYGSAQLAETDVLFFEAINADREGRFFGEDKKDMVFRESKFSETYSNFFAGTKSINWEAVSLTDEKKNEKKNYYHLNFRNQDRITDDGEIDEFLSFSSVFGIDVKDKSTRTNVNLSSLARIFSDRDDTETNVDVYFTDKGIRKMDEANFNQALAAHLVTQGSFNPTRQRMPFVNFSDDQKAPELDEKSREFQVAKRYADIQNKWFFTRWWFWGEMNTLNKEYSELTGRNVVEDANAIREATTFADKMANLDGHSDESSVQKFFTFLGKSTGFDFMKTIAAMSLIAGPEDTLIHQISMSGGGISLCSVDEGEIVHPEKEVTLALASLA